MHLRKRQAFSLLSIIALIFAAGGVTPAAAATQSPINPRAPHPPIDRSALLQHIRSLKPATLDSRLINVKGPVTVLIELTGDPAVVTYANTQSSTHQPSLASSTAKAQLSANQQAQSTLSAALRRLGATEIYRVQRVYNGIAVRVDASQLPTIRQLGNVKAVHLLTPDKLDLTSSVPLIGAPALWDPGALNLTGTGIKIGIIDSGIDYEHADFGGFGAISPTVYVSNDTTLVGDVPGFPSAKVAGGHDFAGDSYDADTQPVPHPDDDPAACLTGGDSADHGTHVAGIAAGYGVTTGGLTYTGTYTATLDETQFRIGPGVAPGAQLYALRVFGCNGTTNLTVPAIDWAADPNGDGDFSDHLDVINMSLGSDYGSPYDADSVASDNASLAGVIVVASAGNAGNVYNVVGAPAVSGRAIAVASSRDADAILDGFRVDDGVLSGTIEPASESAAFDWLTATLPITGELVYPDIVNVNANQRTGCFPFTGANATALVGKIALLDWDTPSCGGSVTRTGNAFAAGAIGVLIADDTEVFDLSITGSSVIPALSIPAQTGDDLKANLPLTMTFDHQYAASLDVNDPTIVDTISDFSSRGASLRTAALKPDITAPGESIFSAHNGTGDQGINFSGTSMAAPHVAGAMALLREMHPLWSPEELKALAMNTALHDLRLDPSLSSQTMSPARSGAGRIDLANTLGTDQVAFNSGQPGLVSVSFGAVEVLTTTTLVRRVRVENQSTSPVTYTASYSEYVAESGVSFEVSPDNFTVGPQSAASVVITMTADASAMIKDQDPSVVPTFDSSWISEAQGYLVLDTGVTSPSPLRVPVYAAARPISAMSAVQSSVKFGATDAISLTGTGINTGGEYAFVPNITSYVVPFEAQYHQDITPTGVPYLDLAIIKDIGITSDNLAEGTLFDTEMFIGLSTYGNWSSPVFNDTEFDVYFDVNNDGVDDFALFNTPAPDSPDTFLTELVDLNTFDTIFEDYINYWPGTFYDMANYNTSTLILPVWASDLGLTPGHSRFHYWVGIAPRETAPLYVDASPVMTYDAGQPGLDFTDGVPGLPYWADEPGDSFPVVFNSLAAYQASASQGVLLLHLHNGSGHRSEVVNVVVPKVQLSTAAQSVVESAGVVSVTATLDTSSGVTVTVPYTVAGTATGGTDYTGFASGSFTFAPGITTTTKTLTVVDDHLVEPAETVIVTLGTPANAALGAPSVETITINDNDVLSKLYLPVLRK